MRTGGRRFLAGDLSDPPPFLRQLYLPSLLPRRFFLGASPRLRNSSGWFRRSWLSRWLQRPRRRQTRRSKITRNPQLLRKILLPNQRRRQLRGLIDDRSCLSLPSHSGFLSSRRFPPTPLLLRNKQPDRPHQMLD